MKKLHESFKNSLSYGEADVGAVVEAVVAGNEGFGGHEGRADVERVFLALFCQPGLALGKRRAEKRVAVGGEDDVPGLEVERDEANMTLVDRETVDHAVAVVLVLHGLEHAGDNGLAGSIGYFLATDGYGIRRMGKPLLIFGTGYDDVGTMLSQFCFVGFGIVEKLVAHQTLAIAHEPDFAAQATVDDCRGCHALLGVLLQADHYIGLMASPEGDVMSADRGSHADTELMTGGVGRHLADMAGDGQHGIAPVAHAGVMSAAGLRCGAVDDCDEIICDNDSVLAFPGGILWCEALLDDLHA